MMITIMVIMTLIMMNMTPDIPMTPGPMPSAMPTSLGPPKISSIPLVRPLLKIISCSWSCEGGIEFLVLGELYSWHLLLDDDRPRPDVLLREVDTAVPSSILTNLQGFRNHNLVDNTYSTFQCPTITFQEHLNSVQFGCDTKVKFNFILFSTFIMVFARSNQTHDTNIKNLANIGYSPYQEKHNCWLAGIFFPSALNRP